jgi:Tol biopolymer transport system component
MCASRQIQRRVLIYSQRISDDGRQESEYLTHVWTANSDGSDAYQMTFGDKSSSNPDWSPDGKMDCRSPR